MTSVAQRVRANPLITNSLALMASTIGSGALGLAFWVLAAHLFTAADVGRVSAEIASITLVASLGQIALTSMFARFLPVARQRTGMIIRRGYAASLTAAWVLGCGFVALRLGRRFLPDDFATVAVFVLAILVYAVFALQDVVLTALRRAPWVLAENIVVAVARLALLPIALLLGGHLAVLGAWAVPTLAAVGVVNWLVFRRLVPQKQQLGDDAGRLPTRRQLVSFGSAQFVSGIVANIGTMLPPVLVAARFGPTASASFYFPWLICTTCNALLWNIVFPLVVEAMHDAERTRPMLRRAAAMGMLVTCGAAVVFGAGAPWILGLVGAQYRDSGTVVLRLIALALPFVGVNSIYSALAVIERRTWFTTAMNGVATVVILLAGGILLMPRIGLSAFGLSFLLTEVATAMVAAFGILRRYERLVMLDKTVVLHLHQQIDDLAADTQLIFPLLIARQAGGQPVSSVVETVQFTVPHRRWEADPAEAAGGQAASTTLPSGRTPRAVQPGTRPVGRSG